MAKNKLLGITACCTCGKDAEVRESTKGKAYYSCEACCQVFTRSSSADMRMRAQMKAVEPSSAIPSAAEGEEFGQRVKPPEKETDSGEGLFGW